MVCYSKFRSTNVTGRWSKKIYSSLLAHPVTFQSASPPADVVVLFVCLFLSLFVWVFFFFGRISVSKLSTSSSRSPTYSKWRRAVMLDADKGGLGRLKGFYWFVAVLLHHTKDCKLAELLYIEFFWHCFVLMWFVFFGFVFFLWFFRRSYFTHFPPARLAEIQLVSTQQD